MRSPPKSGTTPRKSIEAAHKRLGTHKFVDGCLALLDGRGADPQLILALGGRPARWAAGFDEVPGPEYWLRVWAARGLLYVWQDRAKQPILHAMGDDAWRVREMALKVAIRHGIRPPARTIRRLREDPNARVRAAAMRAVPAARLTRGG
jgi:hypothetical protein